MYRNSLFCSRNATHVLLLVMGCLLWTITNTSCHRAHRTKSSVRSCYGGSATQEMTDVSYWNPSDTIILTPEQIVQYNNELIAQGNLDLVDITIQNPIISKDVVEKGIAKYTIANSWKWLDTMLITAEDKQALYESRNLGQLNDTIIVRYGVITHPTNMRSFPTDKVSSKDKVVEGPQCYDRFQETQLRLGEGVHIWHQTADGEWFFVRATDYAGWIKAQHVGLCTYEDMCAYIQKEPFCVVTDIYDQTIQDVTMRLNMGTKLPYNTQKNKALAPIRMHDGSLAICETTMAGDIHQGYLPYTTLNVLTLAFKQQGFPYDWGCKNGYNDCSGLAQSVYRCMGIQLPRNTSSMRRIQRNMHSEGGINFDYTQFMPGSILLSQGHTMILVGTIDKNPIIIHAFGSYKQPPTWEKRQVSATCITSMSDLYWTDGERSIESIGHVYEIK